MDMTKVFIDRGRVPPDLQAQVEKARLTVELCNGCGTMTENISKRCRQLEKLKMEIESGLESIHLKMAEADEKGRTEQFRRAAGSSINFGIGDRMEILEVLRMDAMQKCSHKISSVSPRIQIRRLTWKEYRNKIIRPPQNEAKTHSEQNLDSGIHRHSFKMEEFDRVNFTLEVDPDQDHSSETSFGDDFNDDGDFSKSTPAKRLAAPVQGRVINMNPIRKFETLTGEISKPKRTFDAKTGKYKCTLCSKEYASGGAFYNHYNTAHRQRRFNCKICGKSFSQRGDYKIHHLNVHMGVRFKCQVCKKIFSHKATLMIHQRKEGCATG